MLLVLETSHRPSGPCSCRAGYSYRFPAARRLFHVGAESIT